MVAEPSVPGPSPPDLTDKLNLLAAMARDRGLSVIVLREQASLSWLLGVRSNVPQTLDSSCFDVVVDVPPSGDVALAVVTNSIEAPRLQDTELAGLPATWTVVPWWESRDAALPTGPGVTADRVRRRERTHRRDGGVAATADPGPAEQLAAVCADAAAAVTAAASALAPGTTEFAAAGEVARQLLDRYLDPVVLLVAGRERMAVHRHPLPTRACL